MINSFNRSNQVEIKWVATVVVSCLYNGDRRLYSVASALAMNVREKKKKKKGFVIVKTSNE